MDSDNIETTTEEQPAETQPQSPQTENKIDLTEILTNAALKHPAEVNDFLDEVVGAQGKALIVETVRQTNPILSPVIDKLFPTSGRAPPKSLERDRVEDEDDDYDEDEITDEAIEYAVSKRKAGYTYALISEKIWNKYRIDWLPVQIKRYVMEYEEKDPGQSTDPRIEKLVKEKEKLERTLTYLKIGAVSLVVASGSFILGRWLA